MVDTRPPLRRDAPVRPGPSRNPAERWGGLPPCRGARWLTGIRYIAHPDNSASRRRLEEDFVRLGVRPPAPVCTADWDTAVLLAELDVGHAVLPALPLLLPHSGTPLRTVPVPDLTPLTVGCAARRWQTLSPPAAEFASLVTRQLTG